jgi:hypothetical protein
LPKNAPSAVPHAPPPVVIAAGTGFRKAFHGLGTTRSGNFLITDY